LRPLLVPPIERFLVPFGFQNRVVLEGHHEPVEVPMDGPPPWAARLEGFGRSPCCRRAPG
jgi:hypothetical protein